MLLIPRFASCPGVPLRRTPLLLAGAALAALLAACAAPAAGPVRIVVSSRLGDRLAEKPALRFGPASESPAVAFAIDDTATFQTIAGFGASFLEAGLICLRDLPAEAQEEVFRACFDPDAGAGFSAMKTVLAGTDFMSAGPWYTYCDTPGDAELKTFSIARDLGPCGLVTYIQRARRYGSFLLEAPMDYPPDWMLTNVEDRKKQDVDARYFDALARYYLRYLQEYEKHGIFIDYLSPFNEPGIYTKIPAAKIRDLVRDHLGPLLHRSGVKTRLMSPESNDRSHAAKNLPVLLDDPGARRHVSVLAYHGYDFRRYDAIAALHERYPDLPVWMTEVCHAYQAGTSRLMVLPRLDFEDGAFWGDQIVSDLESGASAWIYWNLILDEKGGPWLVSPVHGNPDPNIQHPVVVVNRKEKTVVYTGLYYYLAHFSRFVRPGAVRVKTSGGAAGVRAVAFRGPDGRLVAQVLNAGKEPAEVRLDWRGRSLELPLPPVSITTAAWDGRP